MKMIVAVVRDEFAPALTEGLTRKGFGATKLASTGGFLRAGNTTFLIGLAANQLDQALGIIRAACPSTKSLTGDLTLSEGTLKGAAAGPGKPLASAIQVGGATVFVMAVEQMVKL